MSIRDEIGSEFWTDAWRGVPQQVSPWDGWCDHPEFFVSGRTALNAIIEDALASRLCKKAYLPSYCCHTMIEPFLHHGLTVNFYSVTYENGRLLNKIDPNYECDLILLLNYFGFASPVSAGLPAEAITIRDLTHSLLSYDKAELNADYLFASFRKWDAIAGAAIACKRKGRLAPGNSLPHKEYIALRNRAYGLKASYMAGDDVDKQSYLQMFQNAENLLEEEYAHYPADPDSLQRAKNVMSAASVRRRNAEILLSGLKETTIASPFFSELGEKDVPLFVPVMVKHNLRNALRQYLIDRRIYCPVHWPISPLHRISEASKVLYVQELSLICDQRYGRDEMQRQIDAIKSFDG